MQRKTTAQQQQQQSRGPKAQSDATEEKSCSSSSSSSSSGHWSCCHRRQSHDKGGTFQSLRPALRSALLAASRALGAAGGGWAAARALSAAAEVLGLISRPSADEGSAQASKMGCCAGSTEGEDNGPIPRHIAVIMDGNRRFGRREHGSSISGHRAGGEKLRDFLKWSVELGVEYLTVFAFSTENWKRDPQEVDGMMQLFLTEVPRLGKLTAALNVKVKFLSSDVSPLSEDVAACLAKLEKETEACTGLQLNVCLSYGGRGDIVMACRKVAEEVASGTLALEDIDEQCLGQRLLTGDIPDPDILVRTSGERRLSNFLMYQLAYCEMFFLQKHWPEVEREDLLEIVASYGRRHRRFGK